MKKGMLFLIWMGLLMFVASCGNGGGEEKSEWVTGWTRGVIRSGDAVRVRLATGSLPADGQLPAGLVTVEPGVKGTVSVVEGEVLEFRPEEGWRNGQRYRVKVALGKLGGELEGARPFAFEVKVMPLTYVLETGGLRVTEGEEGVYRYEGVLLNSDAVTAGEVEELVAARMGGQVLPVEWEHEAWAHRFRVEGVKRGKTTGRLELRFGEAVRNAGLMTVEVPAEGTFEVLRARVAKDGRSVEVAFSGALDAGQDLRGLVELWAGEVGDEQLMEGVTYGVEGNVVRLYLAAGMDPMGRVLVRVARGVAGAMGERLEDAEQLVVDFPEAKPGVRFVGEGTITPAGGEVLVPFEAVGLRAVDLFVTKIYADNMPTYLRDGNYERTYEYALRQAGRPVLCRRVELAGVGERVDLSRWQPFVVRLGDYLTLERGVIYRVELRFRKGYTTLAEAGEMDLEDAGDEGNGLPVEAEEYFDGVSYDFYGYPAGFDWGRRDDPTSDSYYTSDRFPTKNIVVTSLGVTVKGGTDGKYVVAVNDLETAEAVEGCRVVFYNYQGQATDSVETDAEGVAVARPANRPLTVMARQGEDKAYVAVGDGRALSLSNFDVGGEVVQRGIKGFIYGERGVWRPGDKIYLSFMLEDREGVIPEGHPIVAKLFDPTGTEVATEREKRGKRGLYCFAFETKEEAPTGYWRAVVNVGGRSFTRTLRVETVKPNRLSVEVKVPGDVVGKGAGVTALPVATRWLHGASTPGLRAVTELRLWRGQTAFEGYGGYVFDDESRVFHATESTLFEGLTDEEGRFDVPLGEIEAEGAPGMLNARLTTRVFEPGGDFSVVSTGLRYSPYEEYVGIRLPATEDRWYPRGEALRLDGVVLTAGGRPVNGRQVEVEVYRLEWRWWWDAEGENLGYYVNRSYRKPLWKKTFRTDGGRFETELQFGEWGRYFVRARDAVSGHTAGMVVYVSSWDGGMEVDGMATMLTLSTDKRKYEAGERVKVRFPSAEGGVALVSVEDGRTVQDVFRVPTRAGSTTVEIEATRAMCPNVYVAVSLIQPTEGRTNDKPTRLYGVVNVPVEDGSLRLEPEIGLAEELRPSKDFTVTVKEGKGREMTYSLAVVDEGLLSLTSFRTPDPLGAFYAREALGVRTWDFYDDVCGAFGGRLESAFAVGGDEALTVEDEAKANRFTPVVLFEGPFTLKAGETRRHTLRMPEYAGEVRAMVVAEHEGQYGSAERRAKVTKPLMLNVTMPRLFTPGDEIEVPVTVFAMKEGMREATVKVETDELLEVVGSGEARVTFDGVGEELAFVKVRVREQVGTTTLRFTARSGEETATYACDVEVRVPNPRVTRVEARELASGEEAAFDMELEGLEAMAAVEVSSIPALNLEQRLEDLIQYPHGCAEQITSRVLPQLVLDVLMDLERADEVTAEENVKEVIDRLRDFQLSSGGFSTWVNGRQVNEWVTAYVTDFLVQAERRGYAVASGVKGGALSYLAKAANEWRPGDRYDEMEQAYRLYVLAEAGQANLAAMNRLREMESRSAVARWQLAGAYALARHEGTARGLVAGLSTEAEAYRQLGRCYGSTLRDNAILLRSMVDMGMREEAYALVEKMARSFASDKWLSTQESAMGLTAIARYVDRFLEGETGLFVAVNGEALTTIKTMMRQEVKVENGRAKVTVKNEGSSPLHARVIGSSVPLGVVTEREMSGLRMAVRYYRDGKADTSSLFRQGEDVVVEVTVENDGQMGRYEELALAYLFPSGFEYMNERLTSGADPFAEAEHADVRDDRVYVYFSLEQGQRKTFRLRFNAAYPGRYLLPAVNCSAMYDNSITATLPGREIEIRR